MRGGKWLVTVFVTSETEWAGVMMSGNYPDNQGVFVLRLSPLLRGGLGAPAQLDAATHLFPRQNMI